MKLTPFAAACGLALAALSASAQVTSVDLSTYTRTGRYNLPEPTRTPGGPNLLAQEASAITYDRDRGTLFVLGDGGTAIVEVSLTGTLIGSMTLSGFDDPEGLTYIGNGQFVMAEERNRYANLFSYRAGSTLTTAGAQRVQLGTTIGNIGNEGISYDPLTGGYIVVKEKQPEGIFQTTIDFAAGTASNGSPSTVLSANLFNPSLAGLADFADVYALSNLASLRGRPEESHLIVLSQESGRLINIDRLGNVSSSLLIGASDPGTPLQVTMDQQHEGVTMDDAGNIYIVSENGGGDINHPQLWVYSVAAVPDIAASWMLGLGLLPLLVSRRKKVRGRTD